MKHSIDIRVYYEDTDAGGVVYHANYLKFAERGRTEFLRYLGYENNELKKSKGILFVVRHMDINYLKPAFLDDSLSMVTAIESMKNSSFVMHQAVFKQNNVAKDGQEPELICDMHVALVCVDTENYRPVRMPEEVRQALSQYSE